MNSLRMLPSLPSQIDWLTPQGSPCAAQLPLLVKQLRSRPKCRSPRSRVGASRCRVVARLAGRMVGSQRTVAWRLNRSSAASCWQCRRWPTSRLPEDTGEKPQSKVWEYNDQWYSVMPDNSGTWVWKLNGTQWQHQLQLSTE